MEVKWLLYERDQVRRQQEERVEVDRLLEYNGWIMPNHHRRFIACVEGAFLDAPRKDSCLEFGFKQEHVDRGNMPSYNVFIDGESFVAQGDDDTGECPESVRWCCGRNIVTPLAGKCKIGIPQKLLVALCVLFVPLGALSLLALVYYFWCRQKFQQQDADDEATENSTSNNDSAPISTSNQMSRRGHSNQSGVVVPPPLKPGEEAIAVPVYEKQQELV